MTIILSKNGNDAELINKSDIREESYLQEYIQNNPESIPIYEIEEDRKLFVAKREFPTNSGPIDALAIDQTGDIYIVETKLYKNPDKRTVVAQALDYGAALWRHLSSFDELVDILNQETQMKFNLIFQDKAKEFFELDDDQMEAMLDTMQKNLNAGNIRFVILMDKVDERLKDLIIYINQNSQFDIFAVQLEYYKFEEYEIMIPKIFGVEVKKNVTKYTSSTRIYWDKDGFEKEIHKLNPDTKSKVIDLLNFTQKEKCLEGWGTGKIPTYNFKTNHPFRPGKKVTVFTVWSNGYINIGYWLGSVGEKAPDKLREFYQILDSIDGVSFDQSQSRTDRYPIDRINPEGIEKIKEAALWLKDEFQQ